MKVMNLGLRETDKYIQNQSRKSMRARHGAEPPRLGSQIDRRDVLMPKDIENKTYTNRYDRKYEHEAAMDNDVRQRLSDIDDIEQTEHKRGLRRSAVSDYYRSAPFLNDVERNSSTGKRAAFLKKAARSVPLLLRAAPAIGAAANVAGLVQEFRNPDSVDRMMSRGVGRGPVRMVSGAARSIGDKMLPPKLRDDLVDMVSRTPDLLNKLRGRKK